MEGTQPTIPGPSDLGLWVMVVSGPEAESGSRGPGIWALTGLCSLASNHNIQLKNEKQTLEGTAQELRGGSVALQERSVKSPELQEENQMLRKQVTMGGV